MTAPGVRPRTAPFFLSRSPPPTPFGDERRCTRSPLALPVSLRRAGVQQRDGCVVHTYGGGAGGAAHLCRRPTCCTHDGGADVVSDQAACLTKEGQFAGLGCTARLAAIRAFDGVGDMAPGADVEGRALTSWRPRPTDDPGAATGGDSSTRPAAQPTTGDTTIGGRRCRAGRPIRWVGR